MEIFYEPMPGLLSGRHRGALESRGDICAFLDDDVRLGRSWLKAVEESFHNPEIALVHGPSQPLFESLPSDWLETYFSSDQHGRYCAYLSLIEGGAEIRLCEPSCGWGLNYSIRREVLFGVGGFNPDNMPKPLQRFQGDGESGLGLRLGRAGARAIYHPGAVVYHEVPTSRMTVTYFEQRAYYEGVCASYGQIRSHGGLTQSEPSWNDPLRTIKWFVNGAILGNKVQGRIQTAYRAGYHFHQKEVRDDPKLLEWVLRKDYWDYRLPEGWEQYWPMRPTPLPDR